MNKKKYFADIKNVLNYSTFLKLDNTIKTDNRIYFKRLVNGQIYSFKVVTDNHNKLGIIIRNMDFRALALLIDSKAYTNYNNLIESILTS